MLDGSIKVILHVQHNVSTAYAPFVLFPEKRKGLKKYLARDMQHGSSTFQFIKNDLLYFLRSIFDKRRASHSFLNCLVLLCLVYISTFNMLCFSSYVTLSSSSIFSHISSNSLWRNRSMRHALKLFCQSRVFWVMNIFRVRTRWPFPWRMKLPTNMNNQCYSRNNSYSLIHHSPLIIFVGQIAAHIVQPLVDIVRSCLYRNEFIIPN